MSTETCLRPEQSHSQGMPSARIHIQGNKDPYSTAHASSSRSCEGKDNSMDVMKDAAGIAYRLRWKLDEKELALYESPLAQYSEPLEICPLVDGQVHLTKVHALKGKGVTHTNPLGVASGSMLYQMAKTDSPSNKQE
ncbi:hypothetical protein CVIRNUC_006815 [Coccomyxa viridis]|uniref:Uncharacterized protein n=1 Tax=Coccomyxa viridis TaxID=1274662 RepID=A0AAV1I8D8_9CHLO|nr:hypothetical protein CVIRNUC_006815 [Coccomyxa viridis]